MLMIQIQYFIARNVSIVFSDDDTDDNLLLNQTIINKNDLQLGYSTSI